MKDFLQYMHKYEYINVAVSRFRNRLLTQCILIKHVFDRLFLIKQNNKSKLNYFMDNLIITYN